MVPGQAGPESLAVVLRRWAALLALAGMALPGVNAAAETGRPFELWAWPGPAAPELRKVAAAAAPDAFRPLEPGAPWESLLVEPVPPVAGDEALAATVSEPDGTPLPARTETLAPAQPPAPSSPASAPSEPLELARGSTAPTAAAPEGTVEVPPQREYLRKVLIRHAQEQGLPADVVMALAWVESSWRSKPVSHTGAMGVMQLMPHTVEFASQRLLDLDHNLDPNVPADNVRMGTRFLRHLLGQTGGDLHRALVAYNQGITSLKRDGPYGEAVAYADRVLELRVAFR